MFIESAIAKVPKYALKVAQAAVEVVAPEADRSDTVYFALGFAVGAFTGVLAIAILYVLIVQLKLHVRVRHHFVHQHHMSSQEPDQNTQFTHQEMIVDIFTEHSAIDEANQPAILTEQILQPTIITADNH